MVDHQRVRQCEPQPVQGPGEQRAAGCGDGNVYDPHDTAVPVCKNMDGRGERLLPLHGPGNGDVPDTPNGGVFAGIEPACFKKQRQPEAEYIRPVLDTAGKSGHPICQHRCVCDKQVGQPPGGPHLYLPL